jgi:dodecin
MSDHVYKIIEVVGSSEKSVEDAITTAVDKASKTVRKLRWFEVIQTRGEIDHDKVAFYQVHLKLGFTIE